ncbi:unnamed protein product [Allacma fusca]|uniref:Uncharacterized protein n=1 Tax=Allacma fusca TaxID=39272 RepID=A0A8J2JR87_9HEXA|nr:unnamed protein product [Allacma fusca]
MLKLKCGVCKGPFSVYVNRVSHPNCKSHWVHQLCTGDQPDEFGQNRCPVCNFRWHQVLDAVVLTDLQVRPGPSNVPSPQPPSIQTAVSSRSIFRVTRPGLSVQTAAEAILPPDATITATDLATTDAGVALPPAVATITRNYPSENMDNSEVISTTPTYSGQLPKKVTEVSRRSRPFRRRGLTRSASVCEPGPTPKIGAGTTSPPNSSRGTVRENLPQTRSRWQQPLPANDQRLSLYCPECNLTFKNRNEKARHVL